jgi:hypothetical protein
MDYQVPTILERKPAIASAVASVNQYVDRRIGVLADNLSRGAVAAARIALVNECMSGLCSLLYEVDGAGHPVNVDGVTARLLIPLPWGSRGWKVWELRQWEGRHLRRLLYRRYVTAERVALFAYSAECNGWYLNRRYDTPAKYSEYWENHAITPTEWRHMERNER